MFKFWSKKKEIAKDVAKAEEIIKKDIKKAEETIKKDVDFAKQEFKKLESDESFDFFFTYGWAIAVILIGLIFFIWWHYFNVDKESCDFLEGSDFLCENFDVTNTSLKIEIRNMNNKTAIVKGLKMGICKLDQEQNIASNDRKIFSIPCNISSGRFKERVFVSYVVNDFAKSSMAKISKIIP
jgi:Fe2+ transport system protein B